MEQVTKIFNNIEIMEDYSLTSKNFSITPIFQPLPKNRIQRDLYSKIQDNTINELLVTKTYDSSEYVMNVSMIEMNNTTDELLFLTLLSLNRTYIEISLKDLATLMHFGKESGKEKTKDRLMDSVNKLLKCSININFKNSDEAFGFHILKYKYNQLPHESEKTLKIWFDLDFINLYNSSNLSLINTKVYKHLKTDYSKSLYSLINNFSTSDNLFEFNKKVLREKFGVDKLNKNQKERIKKALEELKENRIIYSYTLTKDDALKIKKAPNKCIKSPTTTLTKGEKKVKEAQKKVNKTITENKNDVLDMPEVTKNDLINKFKQIESIATNPHNGLTITEHVKVNKEYERLKKVLEPKEEKVINEVKEEVVEEDNDIVINMPTERRANRTIQIK